MKKLSILFSAITLLVLSTSAFSTEKMDEVMKKMTEALSLTEAQQEPAERILTEHFSQLEAISQSDAGKFSKMRSLRKLTKTKDQKFEELLSAEQYKTYLALQAEKREQFKNHRKQAAN
ncbi:hypothetical protein R50073_34110 [Maricurvus nonylphenolicus]|uniref:hypothetical protein n=1 Tax=Maricurvus nonylphenolicus TaxID=1008307 RepID=UPI0036F198D5